MRNEGNSFLEIRIVEPVRGSDHRCLETMGRESSHVQEVPCEAPRRRGPLTPTGHNVGQLSITVTKSPRHSIGKSSLLKVLLPAFWRPGFRSCITAGASGRESHSPVGGQETKKASKRGWGPQYFLQEHIPRNLTSVL